MKKPELIKRLAEAYDQGDARSFGAALDQLRFTYGATWRGTLALLRVLRPDAEEGRFDALCEAADDLDAGAHHDA